MTANSFGLTRTQKVFIKKETTFGTPVIPAGTDAVAVRSFSAKLTRNRINRADHRATRSLVERITGKRSVEWSLSSYILPGGSAGAEPDIAGDSTDVGLLQGVLSSFTATADGLYKLQAGQTALPFFTMFHQTEDLYGETLTSAWVESVKLSGSGGDPPTLEFEGGAKDYAMSGTSTAVAGGTAATTIQVQPGDIEIFEKGSLIVIGASDNRRVTARASDILTLDTAATWTAGAVIGPAALTPTTAGSPISGVAGSITFTPDGSIPTGAVAINVMDYEVAIKNGITAFDDEALIETVSDFVPGYREVTGRCRFKMRKDWLKYLGARNNLRRIGLTLVLGDTANNKLTVTMPDCEAEFDGVDWQDDREAVINLPFVCLAASGASVENEIEFAFS